MRTEKDHALTDAQLRFERQITPHQESCGAYACDPHAMFDYAIAALKAEGITLVEGATVEYRRGEHRDMTDDEIADAMYCASVVPRRSVNRIRRAIAEGRPIDVYLDEIEHGLDHLRALAGEPVERRVVGSWQPVENPDPEAAT